jgi:hypothetical protein
VDNEQENAGKISDRDMNVNLYELALRPPVWQPDELKNDGED